MILGLGGAVFMLTILDSIPLKPYGDFFWEKHIVFIAGIAKQFGCMCLSEITD